MKITAIVIMASITAIVAQSGETVPAGERIVTVCTEATVGFNAAAQARPIATKIFAAIGVSIHWHTGLRGCPPHAILISLSNQTPPSLFPGAMAYTLPFEGAHICVFYDRIAQEPPPLVRHLLAHVLVHEITHILQGLSAHSAQGVMKAQWTEDDVMDMRRQPLEFTSEDIDRIHRGLEIRSSRISRDLGALAQD